MRPATKNRVCIAGGAFVLLLAIAMVVMGVFLTDIVDDAINDAVEDGLKLTASDESSQRESWTDWVNTDVFFDYHVFNYTNLDAWLTTGVKPTVEETGPYTYQEFSQKYNISFSDDGEVIYYNQWWYKVPVGPANASAEASRVYTPNPVYWALASQVFAIVKQSLQSAIATAGGLPANPDATFPLGLMGPITIPPNTFGPGVPPAAATLTKADSIIGKFAAPLTLAGLNDALAGPTGTLATQLPFLAGYMRKFVNDGYNDASGDVMPLYGFAAEEGLPRLILHVLGVAEAFTGADAAVPEMRACAIGGTVTDATDCPLGAAVSAQINSTDLNLIIAHLASTVFSPTEQYSLLSSESSVWNGAAAGSPTFQGLLAATFPGSATAVLGWLTAPRNAPAGTGSIFNQTEYEPRAVAGHILRVIDGGVAANPTYQANPTSEPTVDAVTAGVTPQVQYLFSNTAGDAIASTFAEVGYAQFARGAATGGTSVSAADAGVRGGTVYFGPEFGVFQAANNQTNGAAPFTTFDIGFDKGPLWLDPTEATSLANDAIYGAFLIDSILGFRGNFFAQALSDATGGAITNGLAYYGITDDNYDLVLSYLQSYLPFHELIFSLMIKESENFGVFFHKTPAELLLGCPAPAGLTAALAPLGQSPDNPGLITSYDDAEDHYAQTKQGRYALYTGTGGKLDLVRQYVAYRGVETLTTLRDASYDAEKQAGLFAQFSGCLYSTVVDANQTCIAWREPEVITGSSNGNHFKPFGEDDDPELVTYRVFIVEGQRVIDAVFETAETVKGIKVNRFVADAEVVKRAVDSSSPNYKYRMDETPTGIVPMTQFARGLPAAVTRPHFWESDVDDVIAKVDGVVPDEQLHTTFIDVEPLTGATMRGAKRFQNNLRFDPEYNDLPYFSKAWDYIADTNSKYIYLPWYWGSERGVIDDDDASDFRTGVYDNRDLADTLSIVFLVVGIALAAASTICLIFYCRKKGDEGATMPARLESKTTL